MGVYSDLRDAVKARVESVSNVGTVHDRQRYNSNWDKYLEQFAGTFTNVKQIRGWWVTWDGVPEVDGEAAAMGVAAETYAYTIRGIQGMDDGAGTEKTFCDLVENVKNAIRDRKDVGIAAVVDYSVRVTIPVLQLRQFGSVLCHYAEIKVEADVRSEVTYT